MAITYRLVKGTELTAVENDANFKFIEESLQALESTTGAMADQVSLLPVSGLTYYVQATRYTINGAYYSATPGNITLAAADATYDRIDAVYVDINGNIGKLTGVAGATLTYPDIDLETQYLVRFILVKQGATTGSDVDSGLDIGYNFIFKDADEGTWTFDTSNPKITVSASDPVVGTNSLLATNITISDKFTFTSSETKYVYNYNYLVFTWEKVGLLPKYFYIRFYKNGTSLPTGSINFRDGKYGYIPSNNLCYLAIPLVDVAFSSLEFNKIEIYQSTNNASFQLDDVALLVGGSTAGRPVSEQVQVDFAQTDPAAPDFIKNKEYLALNPAGFNNNLEPTDDTLQKIADKFDAFVGGGQKTIETSLPSTIIIDGTKDYHITSGVIKPAIQTAGHVEGKDVEIVSNPTDGASLAIDLTDYPHVQLQGGGFTESPANYYTLETDLADGLLKQHLTLMLWRRNNLFISNSMNYLPETDIYIASEINNSNTYIELSFNKVINSTDLVIGNFSPTFTQNGDTATGVTLTSITDSSGVAISGDESSIRVYFTITGSTNGLATFTITATSLSDLYGNTETSVISDSISLLDIITALSNVIAYWKEGEGDNTVGTATKTDVKNSKVLTASGVSNPTLTSNEWIFNGTNQGMSIVDSEILNLFNTSSKDFQIHFKGNYKDSSSSRIITSTRTDTLSDDAWNFVYKTGVGDFLLNISDTNTNVLSVDTLFNAVLSQDYLFSLKFYQNSGNKIDIYIDNGTTIDSITNIDASTILDSELNKLFVGMRTINAGDSFYNVGFKSMVIANSSANFDTIRTALAL